MDKKLLLEKLNASTHNTLMQTLEIEYTDVGEDFVKATMPVSPKVHQPAGLLHGGATVALAESLGSAASHLFIDNKTQEVRGIEITANHLRSVRDGIVTATAKAIHKGRSTQLWEIRVTDEKDQLISICKLTTIVLDKK
jgi:uncharacterized protein (TIGR00369 family)